MSVQGTPAFPAALQKRPGLGHNHMWPAPGEVSGVNRCKRGADATGSERSRIAHGAHGGAIGYQPGAKLTDALAHRAILVPNGVCLGEEGVEQIFSGGARLLGARGHSPERPVQIHRRRPRSTESLTSFSDALEEVLSRCPPAPLPY
jgi:hypothetical protein